MPKTLTSDESISLLVFLQEDLGLESGRAKKALEKLLTTYEISVKQRDRDETIKDLLRYAYNEVTEFKHLTVNERRILSPRAFRELIAFLESDDSLVEWLTENED